MTIVGETNRCTLCGHESKTHVSHDKTGKSKCSTTIYNKSDDETVTCECPGGC